MMEAFQEGDTLFTVLKRQADRLGDRPFVKDVAESLSYGGFLERVRHVAGGLHGLGVRRGDAVFKVAHLARQKTETFLRRSAGIGLGRQALP